MFSFRFRRMNLCNDIEHKRMYTFSTKHFLFVSTYKHNDHMKSEVMSGIF